MDDEGRVLRTAVGTKLSREQKAGFSFVILCGMLALVFGGQYLWTHMAEPFAINYEGPKLRLQSEEQARATEAQKTLDTDLDSISDYDELYIYKSSPYLVDSDSDGLTDDSEINGGQDPNCALNAPCAAANNEDIVLSSGSADLEAQAQVLAAQQQALEAALSELHSLGPADVRQLLLESGANKSEVEVMTDEQVMLLYQEILTQIETSGEIDKLIPPTLQVPE